MPCVQRSRKSGLSTRSGKFDASAISACDTWQHHDTPESVSGCWHAGKMLEERIRTGASLACHVVCLTAGDPVRPKLGRTQSGGGLPAGNVWSPWSRARVGLNWGARAFAERSERGACCPGRGVCGERLVARCLPGRGQRDEARGQEAESHVRTGVGHAVADVDRSVPMPMPAAVPVVPRCECKDHARAAHCGAFVQRVTVVWTHHAVGGSRNSMAACLTGMTPATRWQCSARLV